MPSLCERHLHPEVTGKECLQDCTDGQFIEQLAQLQNVYWTTREA